MHTPLVDLVVTHPALLKWNHCNSYQLTCTLFLEAFGLSFLHVVAGIAQGLGSFDRHTRFSLEVSDSPRVAIDSLMAIGFTTRDYISTYQPFCNNLRLYQHPSTYASEAQERRSQVQEQLMAYNHDSTKA